jgi:hypothetical protein
MGYSLGQVSPTDGVQPCLGVAPYPCPVARHVLGQVSPGDGVQLWPSVAPNSLLAGRLLSLVGVVLDYMFTGRLRT